MIRGDERGGKRYDGKSDRFINTFWELTLA